jgi:glycosyltransferase involved in cell wall biosynthesis
MAIVTPSLQQARFLEATVASVLGQGFPGLQYVVQDGGSTDGSVEIIRRIEARLHGWASGPDGGQAAAINAGFTRCDGDVMGWLNADDLLAPGALAAVADAFRRHPEVDLIYGHRVVIDADGNETGLWLLPRHDAEVLTVADYVPQETLFWRRRVWEKVGPLDTSFRFAMDWDFLLRAQAAGFRFLRLNRFLGCFRHHAEQKTAVLLHTVGAREMARLRERIFGRVPSPGEISRRLRWFLLRHVALHLAYRAGLVSI